MNILQPGNNPLWFLLTENGIVHIGAIEDIAFTSAFIPWPYAPHIRFLHETSDGVLTVINRDGFLKISPDTGRSSNLAMYRFSGGDFWQQYTVGGFVYYQDDPTALLYLDERFLTSGAPLPSPRTWSFNMNSNIPFPVDIPAFKNFPAEEGWDVDSLRLAGDGMIYYRAARRSGTSPLVKMFRTTNLSQAFPFGTEEKSIEVFHNSAPRQVVFSHLSLPPLPEGFVYTGVGNVGDSLFASWEEQEDFSIGAAGFVVIRR